MDQMAGPGPDLICLPEAFPSQYQPRPTGAESGEPLEGPTVTAIAQFARQKRCYVVVPITCERDGRMFNTAVLLDRDGKVAGTYDKIHPTEGEIKGGITPGTNAPVFETDFGRLGIQTCFDVNWPDGWQALRDNGAELVVWPAAYPGGFPLQALASTHRYAIVTSPWTNPAALIDIDGHTLARSGRLEPWISVPFCLDRGLFEIDFHLAKVRQLERTFGRDISVRWGHDEDAFVLENRIPGKTLSDLVKEFGLVPMDAYLVRAKRRRTARGLEAHRIARLCVDARLRPGVAGCRPPLQEAGQSGKIGWLPSNYFCFTQREQPSMPGVPFDANIPRRRLLQAGACGALAAASSVVAAREPSSSPGTPRPGREVWIASLTLEGIHGTSREEILRKVLERMDQVAGARPDLICLPESFPNQYQPRPTGADRGEPLDGPTITAIAPFARQKRCYVVVPITCKRDGRMFNTAVLLDRDGKVAGTYDKIHPTEGEIKGGITPGKNAPVLRNRLRPPRHPDVF